MHRILKLKYKKLLHKAVCCAIRKTEIVALQGERQYVGYEIESRYCRLAARRIQQFVMEFKAQKVLEMILEDQNM